MPGLRRLQEEVSQRRQQNQHIYAFSHQKHRGDAQAYSDAADQTRSGSPSLRQQDNVQDRNCDGIVAHVNAIVEKKQVTPENRGIGTVQHVADRATGTGPDAKVVEDAERNGNIAGYRQLYRSEEHTSELQSP